MRRRRLPPPGTTSAPILPRGRAMEVAAPRARVAWMACVAILAGAWLLAAPAGVRAGTYTIYSCKKPDGSPGSVSGWGYSFVGASVYPANECPTGGPLRLTLDRATGHGKGDQAAWTFYVPVDT